VRLYRKYELPYAYQGNHKFYQKLHEQFNYALENVDSIRRATGSSASEEGASGESVRQAILKHFIKFIKSLLYIGCAFFIFTLIFKNFDNKSFMDNNKFDIKKAKDMNQRLADVKGIDEIKDEIENLIKMIREPDRYHSKGANLHKGVLLYG
jgi:ATP-dependent Zn protease